MYEYVGGDAYNYIVEASLRGGEISGALTAKAIYFGIAGILLILSLSFLDSDDKKDHGIVSSIPISAPVSPAGKEENEDDETEPVNEQHESESEEPEDEIVEDGEKQP